MSRWLLRPYDRFYIPREFSKPEQLWLFIWLPLQKTPSPVRQFRLEIMNLTVVTIVTKKVPCCFRTFKAEIVSTQTQPTPMVNTDKSRKGSWCIVPDLALWDASLYTWKRVYLRYPRWVYASPNPHSKVSGAQKATWRVWPHGTPAWPYRTS